MAKNKRDLQAELEAANKRIAELSQSNQNANSNINNNEPPSWLKTLLEAQSESQRQMQLESQRQMQQIIERFSQQHCLKARIAKEANHVSKPLTSTILTTRQGEPKRTHKSLPHCRWEFR